MLFRSPEIKTFITRAHEIVMQDRVNVQDAMKRQLKMQRSSDFKNLTGAVERSAGLKEVVQDLEAARVAAECLRIAKQIVKGDELMNIHIDLEQLTA